LKKSPNFLEKINFYLSAAAQLHGSQMAANAGRDDMRKKHDALCIYSEVHSFPEAPHTVVLFHPWFEPVLNQVTLFLNKVFKTKTK